MTQALQEGTRVRMEYGNWGVGKSASSLGEIIQFLTKGIHEETIPGLEGKQEPISKALTNLEKYPIKLVLEERENIAKRLREREKVFDQFREFIKDKTGGADFIPDSNTINYDWELNIGLRSRSHSPEAQRVVSWNLTRSQVYEFSGNPYTFSTIISDSHHPRKDLVDVLTLSGGTHEGSTSTPDKESLLTTCIKKFYPVAFFGMVPELYSLVAGLREENALKIIEQMGAKGYSDNPIDSYPKVLESNKDSKLSYDLETDTFSLAPKTWDIVGESVDHLCFETDDYGVVKVRVPYPRMAWSKLDGLSLINDRVIISGDTKKYNATDRTKINAIYDMEDALNEGRN